ncbi:hypothetical protein [Planomicrobium okeanokoites]|uniref:hypothetical protein n=1 Tax=Planomicrobium okeanokoites TaxID=244 RepID=UPI00248F7280|nr:hypothetical protein [Planomicrobium okeanokoites]
MRKMTVLLTVLFLLAGCNAFDSSDYEGLIMTKDEQSFMLCPCEGDPEAEYPIYEIFSDEQTEVEGKRSNIADIREQDKVRVWVKEGENVPIIAEKISVESASE